MFYLPSRSASRHCAEQYQSADAEQQREIAEKIVGLNRLDIEQLLEGYLRPEKNATIPNPNVPSDGPEVPQLLRLSPCALIQKISRLHSGHRITLNLSNLRVADVLELLYDCEGLITRLEIFNLKDYAAGQTAHLTGISELQQALNEGSVITLKRVIRKIIDGVEQANDIDRIERISKLTTILHDILFFKSLYEGTPLKARIGSDSTGRSPRGARHGPGRSRNIGATGAERGGTADRKDPRIHSDDHDRLQAPDLCALREHRSVRGGF